LSGFCGYRDDILISFAESGENVAQTAPDLDNGI
jgi:hypothetical protein